MSTRSPRLECDDFFADHSLDPNLAQVHMGVYAAVASNHFGHGSRPRLDSLVIPDGGRSALLASAHRESARKDPLRGDPGAGSAPHHHKTTPRTHATYLPYAPRNTHPPKRATLKIAGPLHLA